MKPWLGVFLALALFGSIGVPASWAEVAIAGPSQGAPGQPLTFRLLDGATQIAADHWQQVLNPDRYVGRDYVSSFTLQMAPQTDGSVQVIAPAPGRYKIAAVKGSVRLETSVLVRPAQVAPEIRGAVLTGAGSLDRAHITQMLALAKRAGMTWVGTFDLGVLDFDAGSQDFATAPCSACPGVISVPDLAWLIDAAHQAGLKVAVWIEIVFKKNGQFYDFPFLANFPDLSSIPLSPIMDSYSRFMLDLAPMAQQHRAEALVVGATGAPFWIDSFRPQWGALFAQLRTTFNGELWVSWQDACPPPGTISFPVWPEVRGDGFVALPWALRGSAPFCQPNVAGVNNPTAEQMAAFIAQEFPGSEPAHRQTATGRAPIWGSLITLNGDAINYTRDRLIYQAAPRERDDQEIVDYFEALMRAVGQQARGFFLWSLNISSFGWNNISDPLRQPALLNAIANWWGGDTVFFAPCMAPPPPGVLIGDDFETKACPVEGQDSFRLSWSGPGWTVMSDPQDPTNHVLRGTTNPGPVVPNLGRSRWSDYVVTLRLRLVDSTTMPAAAVSVRLGMDFSTYQVNLGFNKVTLAKVVNQQGHFTFTPLVSAPVSGGTPTGRWFRLEIVALGAMLTVKLDGAEVIRFTDQSAPLLSGGVGLATGSGLGPATADFDDIVVTIVRPALTLTTSVNQSTFAVGQTLTATVGLINPGLPRIADIYLGILRPDNSIQFFTGTGIIVAAGADPASFRPVATGVALATPFAGTATNFYTYQWTGSEPRGGYVLFLAVVTTDGVLGLATASFSFP